MNETAETTFPALMTIPEAARAARVSIPTMYRRVQAGEVPAAIRVGEHGPIRLVESEFRRWLLGPEEPS